jgi:hypothetical protein
MGKDEVEIKDSGKKQEFSTGAHRDTSEGKGRFDLIPYEALQRVAVTYQKGAEKYGENNWKKGMPIERFIDSGCRHAYKHLAGWRDEDHLAMALWNFMGAIFMDEHPEILEKLEE